MTQPVESFVAVAPNQTMSGANNIRQYQLVVLEPSGSYVTVLVEAVSVVDAVTGRALDIEGQEWRDEVVKLLRKMTKGIESMCQAMDVESDFEDQQQVDE